MNEDVWKYIDTDYKVYTESKEIYNKLQLKKYKSKLSATYSKGNKIIGWDFVVPETIINEVKKLIKLVHDAEKRANKKNPTKSSSSKKNQ